MGNPMFKEYLLIQVIEHLRLDLVLK